MLWGGCTMFDTRKKKHDDVTATTIWKKWKIYYPGTHVKRYVKYCLRSHSAHEND